MGEAKLKKSATQRLVAQYPECCFCGGIRAANTREHMPPKALFDSSHRPDKHPTLAVRIDTSRSCPLADSCTAANSVLRSPRSTLFHAETFIVRALAGCAHERPPGDAGLRDSLKSRFRAFSL